jgi:DNA-binding PadR family transcriptional regulator
MRLTPTSYIVLGLISQTEETTPYELERLAETEIGELWSLPHSQLYAEPARLAKGGYLSERQEAGGRRRKLYSLTDSGRKELASWVGSPAEQLPELRDPNLLKLFFGGNPRSLAKRQIKAHEERLESLRLRLEQAPKGGPRGPWRALVGLIGHEEEWIAYWSSFFEDSD